MKESPISDAEFVAFLEANEIGPGTSGYKYIQDYVQKKYQGGELNGVKWTVAVVDDIHLKDHSGSSESDKTYKGIKNNIRDRFRFVSGVDPAPDYPINVTLQSQLERKEQ